MIFPPFLPAPFVSPTWMACSRWQTLSAIGVTSASVGPAIALALVGNTRETGWKQLNSASVSYRWSACLLVAVWGLGLDSESRWKVGRFIWDVFGVIYRKLCQKSRQSGENITLSRLVKTVNVFGRKTLHADVTF